MPRTIREAYREFHRRDSVLQDLKRNLRRIAHDIECLECSMTVAFSHELAGNPHYRKVVDRFCGNSRNAWEQACGTDRGLWKRTRRMPWPMVLEAIALSRKWKEA